MTTSQRTSKPTWDQIDLSVEIPTITYNQATKAKQSTQSQKAKAILQIGAEVRITLLQSPVVVIGQEKDFQGTPQAPTMPGSGLIGSSEDTNKHNVLERVNKKVNHKPHILKM